MDGIGIHFNSSTVLLCRFLFNLFHIFVFLKWLSQFVLHVKSDYWHVNGLHLLNLAVTFFSYASVG